MLLGCIEANVNSCEIAVKVKLLASCLSQKCSLLLLLLFGQIKSNKDNQDIWHMETCGTGQNCTTSCVKSTYGQCLVWANAKVVKVDFV